MCQDPGNGASLLCRKFLHELSGLFARNTVVYRSVFKPLHSDFPIFFVFTWVVWKTASRGPRRRTSPKEPTPRGFEFCATFFKRKPVTSEAGLVNALVAVQRRTSGLRRASLFSLVVSTKKTVCAFFLWPRVFGTSSPSGFEYGLVQFVAVSHACHSMCRHKKSLKQ